MTPEERDACGAMTTGALQVEWVVLMSLGRQLMAEIEAEGMADVQPSVARGLIDRYRRLEDRWDYVDDLLLERVGGPDAE